MEVGKILRRSRKILLRLACGLLFVPACADELTGRFSFSNGDRISGLPEKINEKGEIVLREGEIVTGGVALPYDKLVDLYLSGGHKPGIAGDHVAVLHLTNGDEIRGQLIGLDDEHVTIKAGHFGELRFKRTMCGNLQIEPLGKALYNGPDDLAKWTHDSREGNWTLEGGRLVSRWAGSVARELEFPDQCRIGFNLAWKQNLKFQLLLFSDDGATATPDNCYNLVCQRRFVYLRKRWQTPQSGGTRTIGQPANVIELAEKREVRFEIFMDRETGSVTMYADGRQAQLWTDEDPEIVKFGNWFHFVSEEYPLSISDIRVAAWDGNLPADIAPGDDEAGAGDGGGKIRLADGSEVEGEVVGIENGSLSVRSEGGVRAIPVGQIRTLPLTGSEYDEPVRKHGDIRGWLRDGGRLTFQLKTIEGNKLTGHSQSFGDASFDLREFCRIDFNIYDEELEKRRSEAGW